MGGNPSCSTLKFNKRNFYAFAVTDHANRKLADTDAFAGEEHYMVASDLYVHWSKKARAVSVGGMGVRRVIGRILSNVAKGTPTTTTTADTPTTPTKGAVPGGTEMTVVARGGRFRLRRCSLPRINSSSVLIGIRNYNIYKASTRRCGGSPFNLVPMILKRRKANRVMGVNGGIGISATNGPIGINSGVIAYVVFGSSPRVAVFSLGGGGMNNTSMCKLLPSSSIGFGN